MRYAEKHLFMLKGVQSGRGRASGTHSVADLPREATHRLLWPRSSHRVMPDKTSTSGRIQPPAGTECGI